MGKASRAKRPMAGFSKITFDDDGAAAKVVCPLCKNTACFCNRGLQQTGNKVPASVVASPAASVLSVSVKADTTPTFSFQPYSGYGNTSPPTDFVLDGQADASPGALHEHSRQGKHFFGGGSPSWIFDGWKVWMLGIERWNFSSLPSYVIRACVAVCTFCRGHPRG